MTESTYIRTMVRIGCQKTIDEEELQAQVYNIILAKFYKLFQHGNERYMSSNEIKNYIILISEYISTFNDINIFDGRLIDNNHDGCSEFHYKSNGRIKTMIRKYTDLSKLEEYFHDLTVNNDNYILKYNKKRYPFLFNYGKKLYFQ